MAIYSRGSRKLDTPDQTTPRDDIRLDDDHRDAPVVDRHEDHHDAPVVERHDGDTTRPIATDRATAAPVVVDRARGGLSLGSVITGVLVAFGAFIVLSALIGAIMAALGVTGDITAADARNATIGAGIGLVLAQFLAYLWGGYTAGRMARGSGVLNGLLVPIVALIFVALLGAVIAAIAGDVNVQAETANVERSLPLPLSDLADIGTGVGIGVLVAMLLGGAIGGRLGSRWHTKLEDHEAETVA